MIKSYIKEETQPTKKPSSYPKLMISPNKDIILLVTSESYIELYGFKCKRYGGTIVYIEIDPKSRLNKVGDWRVDWSLPGYEEYFGPVVLEGIKE